jgi:hypothetical protein
MNANRTFTNAADQTIRYLILSIIVATTLPQGVD